MGRRGQRGNPWAAALALLVSSALPAEARAEKYAFYTYPTDPLPSTAVKAIYQDQGGALWLGTELGLVRYDGTSFEALGSTAAAAAANVFSIVADARGRIWARDLRGVITVSPKGVRRVTGESGLPSRETLSMARLADGIVLTMRTPPAVVTVRAPNDDGAPVVAAVNIGPSSPSVDFTKVLATEDGTILVGTKGDGLRVVPRSGEARAILPGADVSALARARGGRALVGVAGAAYVLDGDGAHPLPLGDGLRGASVSALFEARDGTLYASTDDGRLFACRGTTEPCGVLAEGTPKTSDSESAIVEDGSGLIWAALLEAPAVLRYRPGDPRATVVDAGRGFPFADVLTIHADRFGLVFVGTANGLARVEGGAIVNYLDSDGLPGSTVWSTTRLAQPDGRLVLGTQNGVALFDGHRAQPLLDESGKPVQGAVRLMALDDRRFLMGTKADGLRRVEFVGGRARVQVLARSKERGDSMCRGRGGLVYVAGQDSPLRTISGDDVRVLPVPELSEGGVTDSVACGRDDRLWLGTNRGLLAWDRDGSVTRFDQRTGLLEDDVDLVFEASDGTVWLSYVNNRGATWLRFPGAKPDPKTAVVGHLSMENGLPSDSTYAFAESVKDGPSRGMWIGTSRGLLHVGPGGRQARYGKHSGLASEDISFGGITVDDDGALWVGTSGGLSYVDPTYIRPVSAPEVSLTSSLLGGLATADGDRVPFERRDFEAHFTAMPFQNEEETLFRYRLAGYRDPWTPWAKGRTATFANLAPGAYRFEVEAKSADGRPSPRPASARFVVTTPLHMTVWFRTLAAALAAVALVSVGFRARVSQLRRRNEELKQHVAERTAELSARMADLNKAFGDLKKANADLVASQKRADRIFSALAVALPGTVLDGKYRIDERIGEGGVGVVFRGMHLGLGRPIAVKIFRPRQGNDSAEGLERFRLEGMSAARVAHPNAVQVYDFGISSEGIAYIVMQLLEGHPLSDEVATGAPLSNERALAIVGCVASVLETAHGAGLVHRDIKPENVFLQATPEGEIVKVVDFGIAKVIDHTSKDTPRLTMEGSLVGTPAFMAPERFDEEQGEIGPPSDVYSLGVLAFQLLTGRLPFTGNTMVVMTAHLIQAPPPPSTLRADLSREVDSVILAAMAKEPTDRPSAARFAADLGRALEGSAPRLATDEGRPAGE